MIWVTVIMGLLSLLLTWLTRMKSGGGMLGDRERQKLNGLIYRTRQVEDAAVACGCKPGGEPLVEEEEAELHALPKDREGLRQTILSGIDRALEHTWIVKGDNRLLLQAQRAYWEADDGSGLDKLLTLISGESHAT